MTHFFLSRLIVLIIFIPNINIHYQQTYSVLEGGNRTNPDSSLKGLLEVAIHDLLFKHGSSPCCTYGKATVIVRCVFKPQRILFYFPKTPT